MAQFARQQVERFRMDAARWVRPERVASLSEVKWPVAARLLFRHPPLRAMAWFRLANWAAERHVPGFPGYVQRRLLRLYGLEISPSNEVGGGLYISHPVGCTLSAERIGENVTIVAAVTLGRRKGRAWPCLGDNVYVGAGARILGGIVVGDGAIVGANAVVVHDVPPGATVVGVPAGALR